MTISANFHHHRVNISGTDGEDQIIISRDGSGHLLANGQPVDDATVSNTDLIRVNGGDGGDVIALDETGGPLPAADLSGGNGNDTLIGGSANYQLLGGDGNDFLIGGAGNDTLRGGRGNDFVDGDQGADTAFLGAGNDVFRWDQGDGSDRVDGGSGFDELLFNGFGVAEQFTLSGSGGHALFTRVQGSIVMDLTNIEHVTINPFPGADTVTINDPTGTGVSDVDINLGFDTFGDQININDDDDVQVVVGQNGNLTILGLSGATVHITGFEAGTDHLLINGDLFPV